MFVRNAAALFFTVSSLSSVLAEVITVTQYASTCSAIYTTGTRSVTIVQSTTTVVPVAYDDAAWNGGAPFVLEIEPDSPTDPLARRQSLIGRSWVALDGNTTTDPLTAGQYYIRSGQLMSVNGSSVSTDLNVVKQPFSIKPTTGSISTYFSFKDGMLNWTSPRFTGGRVKFCKQPVNLVDNAQVLAQFIGPVVEQGLCAAVRMIAKPCDEVNPLSSSSVTATRTGTVSVPTSMSMQSMTNGPPDQHTPPPFTYSPGSSSAESASSANTIPPAYSSPTISSSISSLSSIGTPGAYPSASTFPVALSSFDSPPIYGSQTISSVSSSSSVSSIPSPTFAPSGSPIGPVNPPYSVSDTISDSSSSSLSLSSGGVRTSASASSASSLSLPPIYTQPSMSMSISESSSSLSGSVPSITFVPSGTRSEGFTLPAVTPSLGSSSSASSSQSQPEVYPGGSSTPSSAVSIELPVSYPGGPSTVSSSASLSLSSISSSSTTISSTSSEINPPFYSSSPQPCPEGKNSIYIDAAGFAYTIYCAMDSFPSSYSEPLNLGFGACIQRCDFDPQCGAVSHNEDNDDCYLKPTPQSYVPGLTNLAVRVAGAPVSPPAYTVPSSSMSSSSAEVPQQYGSTTSSSMVMSSSSSSMMSSSLLARPTMSSSASSSSSMSSSLSSSSSSSEVQEQYPGATTSLSSSMSSSMTFSSSSSLSSSSSEVQEQYPGPATSSSSSMSSSMTSSSSSSIEVPNQYGSTTSSASSSTGSGVPDQYAQTTSSSSSIPTLFSSSSSSSTASSTIPYSRYLVLPSPTPCDYGDPPNYNEDDSYCELALPFPMNLYGSTSRLVFPSSNGYIGLNRGSSQFQVRQFPNSAIPENTVAPFFDDLMLYGNKNPRQGLYYQIEGGSKVTFEWYVGRSAQLPANQTMLSQSIYHFTMAYDSAVPNTFVYTYYQMGNASMGDEGVNGASAAVGMQGCKFFSSVSYRGKGNKNR